MFHSSSRSLVSLLWEFSILWPLQEAAGYCFLFRRFTFTHMGVSIYPYICQWAFMVVQMVKNLPATRETWIWSLGWEDPLEEGMATHSIKLFGQRSLVGYNPRGCEELDTAEWLSTHISIYPFNHICTCQYTFSIQYIFSTFHAPSCCCCSLG